MQNTSEILPDNCPVRIKTGSYRNRYGTTCSLPDEAGVQWVQLKPKGKEHPKALKFGSSQLADMRPLPLTLSAAA